LVRFPSRIASASSRRGVPDFAHFMAIMNDPTTRRWMVAVVVMATTIGFAGWLATIVAANGLVLLDTILVVAFATKILWSSSMFWNSLIGFVVRHLNSDHDLWASSDNPVSAQTAIAIAIRNEDAAAVFARLEVIKASIDATGYGDRFSYAILSDSTSQASIEAEERLAAAFRLRLGDASLIYRRRDSNTGFKSGNLRDFCARWGTGHEFMVPLDADSIMTGPAILRLVRIMQANPKIGMLQSLIDCVLPPTGCARIFEFGHRLAWHNYILGSVWWQQDRGQFRGHNAAVRIAPYVAHCDLSKCPDVSAPDQYVMCHDQIEALLMHRAGFEVRELPVPDGSYEGLPPTVPDFLARYQRWCQGNLRNLRLLALPGISGMDCYHVASVAIRFLGWPAFVVFVAAAIGVAARWPQDVAFPAARAQHLYAAFFLLYFAPRVLGLTDAALSGARRYGGGIRLLIGGVIDVLFTILFLPAAMVGMTWFMVGLLFGRSSSWTVQERSSYSLSWSRAVAATGAQTTFGIAMVAALLVWAPNALPWFMPFALGLVFAAPLSVLTATPAFSAWMDRWSICAEPEDIVPPPELKQVRQMKREGGLA
jgi:membrane glycosyltransferase